MVTNKAHFSVEANAELYEAIQAARKAGRRYGGKLFSSTLAFELGARILLGLEENEEEAIKQEIEELRSQKAALEQKEKLRFEQLKIMEASKTAKFEAASDKNNNVQKLAQRIIEIWDKVTLENKRNLIDSLVNIDKTRLSRRKLEEVFPQKFTHRPSIDEAVKIAINLLDYEGETIGA